MSNTSVSIKEGNKNKINEIISNRKIYEYLFEFVGAFILIFCIDLGFSLGELKSDN